ncbi:MAG: 30S ribosomal protein S6 [Patescibacteria group bacterium]
MEKEPSDKKSYEISFLVKDEVSAQKIASLIRQHGGAISFESSTRNLALAYKINKETNANFGYFHFEMAPEELPTLDRNLKTSNEVMRFLIITPAFSKAKSTPTLKPRLKPLSPRPIQEVSKVSIPLSNEAIEKKIEEILR